MTRCILCFENAYDLVLLRCGHSCCRDCYVQYLQHKINSFRTIIFCPMKGCAQELSFDEVTQFVSTVYTNRLRRNINHLIVLCNPEYLKLCPKCEALCERSDSHDNSMCCSSCGYCFCFRCGHIYNASVHTCERILIESVVQENNENMKICPHCHIIVEREEGCDSVICGYCGYKFCWNCMRLAKDISDAEYHRLQCKGYDGFADDNELK